MSARLLLIFICFLLIYLLIVCFLQDEALLLICWTGARMRAIN